MTKPFAPTTNYTKIDNSLLDEIMPTLKPTHWQVLCFIVRKTKGWQKEEDAISYSQIMDGTGISSKSTVSSALSNLVESGYITVRNGKDDQTNLIKLNLIKPASATDKKETMPYTEYLKTEHWSKVRKASLQRARYKCQLCKGGGELHVHHNTYENRGHEEDSDVIVLCRSCHAQFHGKGKPQ